jgi:hypothetical protein
MSDNTESYELPDNALVQVVAARVRDGETKEELESGEVKPAIEQLSEEGKSKLWQLTGLSK